MPENLSFIGWTFMIIGWAAIIALNIYCFYHLFKEKKETIVDPLEVEAKLDKLDK